MSQAGRSVVRGPVQAGVALPEGDRTAMPKVFLADDRSMNAVPRCMIFCNDGGSFRTAHAPRHSMSRCPGGGFGCDGWLSFGVPKKAPWFPWLRLAQLGNQYQEDFLPFVETKDCT
jgi:hypothetical protein